ncbi:hypothetical protein B5M42_004910 [Paenibacillus athensensis]|uniref:papain fold toxin domain-containing protein n=1 Tax=Paenibacillus athensensis TaxID=1967502 RepID=UPI001431B8B6|nr:hypothetical protein [Paenibacillus athensensis]
MSDSYQNGNEAISINGFHTGILYEDKVYDNIHKEGVPYQTWLDDFSGFGQRTITRDKIN